MKRLYIIVILLPLCTILIAQAPPSTQMQSTSSYRTGTNVPIAAKDLNGSLATPPQATITYSVNNAPSPGSRRVISSGDEDLRPADPKDPYLTPIGDAFIPLLLMVMAYAAYTLLRRRRSRV